MQLSEEKFGSVVVLRPDVARLDASNAPALGAELIRRINAGEHLLVLDLGGVTFMDSSALNRLLKKSGRKVFAAILAQYVAFLHRKKLHLGGLNKPKTLFQQPAKASCVFVEARRMLYLFDFASLFAKNRYPLFGAML